LRHWRQSALGGKHATLRVPLRSVSAGLRTPLSPRYLPPDESPPTDRSWRRGPVVPLDAEVAHAPCTQVRRSMLGIRSECRQHHQQPAFTPSPRIPSWHRRLPWVFRGHPRALGSAPSCLTRRRPQWSTASVVSSGPSFRLHIWRSVCESLPRAEPRAGPAPGRPEQREGLACRIPPGHLQPQVVCCL